MLPFKTNYQRYTVNAYKLTLTYFPEDNGTPYFNIPRKASLPHAFCGIYFNTLLKKKKLNQNENSDLKALTRKE